MIRENDTDDDTDDDTSPKSDRIRGAKENPHPAEDRLDKREKSNKSHSQGTCFLRVDFAVHCAEGVLDSSCPTTKNPTSVVNTSGINVWKWESISILFLIRSWTTELFVLVRFHFFTLALDFVHPITVVLDSNSFKCLVLPFEQRDFLLLIIAHHEKQCWPENYKANS